MGGTPYKSAKRGVVSALLSASEINHKMSCLQQLNAPEANNLNKQCMSTASDHRLEVNHADMERILSSFHCI